MTGILAFLALVAAVALVGIVGALRLVRIDRDVVRLDPERFAKLRDQRTAAPAPR